MKKIEKNAGIDFVVTASKGPPKKKVRLPWVSLGLAELCIRDCWDWDSCSSGGCAVSCFCFCSVLQWNVLGSPGTGSYRQMLSKGWKDCVYGCFLLPCHMVSHTPSSKGLSLFMEVGCCCARGLLWLRIVSHITMQCMITFLCILGVLAAVSVLWLGLCSVFCFSALGVVWGTITYAVCQFSWLCAIPRGIPLSLDWFTLRVAKKGLQCKTNEALRLLIVFVKYK